MHKIKTGSDPAAFHTTFKVTFYWSLKRFTSLNYSKPKTRLRLGYDLGVSGHFVIKEFTWKTDEVYIFYSLFIPK